LCWVLSFDSTELHHHSLVIKQKIDIQKDYL